MTGLPGLFVARDGSNNGTTPKGARIALGGLMAGNGASPLDVRAGVLVDNGGALVSGAGDMSYNVRAFRAISLVSAANGPTLGANDATVNVTTTAAPGANSRIDTIWARQHLVTGDGDTDTTVDYEIGVSQGVAAGSPAAPAIPAGAIALYNVTVTAGVTATSGLTFTRVHAWTVANGGIIPIFSSGERAALAPYEGMAIWYSPAQELQVRNSSGWVPLGGGQANPIWVSSLTASTGAITTNVETALTGFVEHGTHSRPGTGNFTYASGVLTCVKAGLYRINARVKWTTDADSFRDLNLKIDSTIITVDTVPGNGNSKLVNHIEQVFYLSAGQTLSLTCKHNGGSGISIDGSASTMPSQWSVEYLGTPAT